MLDKDWLLNQSSQLRVISIPKRILQRLNAEMGMLEEDVDLVIEFDQNRYSVHVSATLVNEAKDFFAKMDLDMDGGWQMSRWWVPDPDETQRCQIVSDKLLNAINNESEQSALMMCAYILNLKPDTRYILINTDGEIQGTEFQNSVPAVS